MALTDKEIVWLASYPRSGNSWVRFLFGAYAHGGAHHWTICNYAISELHVWLNEGKRNGWDYDEVLRRAVEMLESFPASAYRPRQLALKTHFKWSPEHIFQDRTRKVIYLLRHPKDVLLSWLNYQELVKRKNRSPETDAAHRFIEAGGDPLWVRDYGTWFEHYESWNRDPQHPTLLIRYEDLKRDTLNEFLRMITFLGLPVDEERARRSIAVTSMQKLRQLEVAAREQGTFFDAKEGRYFIHKGASGQSLCHLGEALDEAFDQRFAPWLEASGYLPTPSINNVGA